MKGFLNNSEDVRKLLLSLATENRTGELLIQRGEEGAKIYLHQGKVVWAFATGQRESFQSILLKEFGLSRDQLLTGIKEARKGGQKNLDDILLVIGVADAADRRTIVERHTRAALEVIANQSLCAVQFNEHSNEHSKVEAGEIQGMELETLSSLLTSFKSNQEQKVANYKTEIAPSLPANTINEILERLRIEIPQFLAAMVVEGRTSMPIATLSEAPNLDPEVISAFSQNLLRSAVETCKTVSNAGGSAELAETEILEEVLISTKNDYMILRSLSNGSHFLYLLIDQTSNPGMAKVTIRRYLDQLNAMLA